MAASKVNKKSILNFWYFISYIPPPKKKAQKKLSGHKKWKGKIGLNQSLFDTDGMKWRTRSKVLCDTYTPLYAIFDLTQNWLIVGEQSIQ